MAVEPSGNCATAWHRLSTEAALASLRASPRGLGARDAAARLIAHGPNVLAEGHRRSPLAMFLGQFTDFMIVVLLAAAARERSATQKTRP